MAVSIDDAIEERTFELMMYITNLIGSQVSNEVLQKIAVKLDECKAKIKDLVKDTKMLLEDLNSRLEATEKAMESLSSENTQLKRQLMGMQDENLSLKQKLQKLEERIRELEAEKSRLEKENDDLVTQLSKLQVENDELREKLWNMEEENQRLKEQVSKLQEENEWLKNKVGKFETSWEVFENALIKAANMLKREMHDDVANIRDTIRQLISELRMYVNPKGRARLERINGLVNMMYNKIIYRDIASVLVRYIREILEKQKE